MISIESAGTDTDPLIVNGSLVSAHLDARRKLAFAQLTKNPSEAIVYDSKYLDVFKNCIHDPQSIQIREYKYAQPE